MRLRRRYKRLTPEELKKAKAPEMEVQTPAKEAVPVKSMRKIRKLFRDPNFSVQIMTVLLTMTSDNVRMDRRIETMTTTVDKVRNVSELINNTMRSLKTAVETPSQIKRLLK